MKRIEVAQTGSTNADLVAAATADPAAWPHLSALYTRDQTAGRGRLDRTWTAPPGTALALSVLVRTDIPAALRGWIPLIAGVAMTRAVAAQLPGHDVALKWPNDVLVGDRKICGILAEALPDAIVIGSGVNTRMTADQLPVPTATSFAVLDAVADEDALIDHYLEGLDERLTALAAGEAAVRAEVSDVCGTLGRQVAVSLPGGRTLYGRAERLDPEGRLVVTGETGTVAVSAGDVVHVR